MKKFLATLFISSLLLAPLTSLAAGGIYAYGGGTKQEGETFTVTVTANGAEFDSIQGTINVSGPVSVVSFGAGGATWLPGKTPANSKEFVGITPATSSLTVATIRLKATKAGSGAVSVSGVKMARNGAIVGSSGGNAGFTIARAPQLPGEVVVSSSTHPDQNTNYDSKTIELSWAKASGVTDFSYLLDQIDSTTPDAKSTGSDISKTYTVDKIGVYYFHIRAKNSDGWGPTTHFKINIKAAVDQTLAKTTIISIEKTTDFKINLIDGTVTGVIFKGKALKGYTVSVNLSPTIEGMTIKTIAGQDHTVISPSPSESTTATPSVSPSESASTSPVIEATSSKDELVDWQLIADKPLKAGFYKVTAQAEANGVLTPASDEIMFEITLAKGGDIHMLTQDDLNPSGLTEKQIKILGINITRHPLRWVAFLTIMIMLILGAIGYVSYRSIKKYRTKKISKITSIQ